MLPEEGCDTTHNNNGIAFRCVGIWVLHSAMSAIQEILDFHGFCPIQLLRCV
jgi:hypothetical protein